MHKSQIKGVSSTPSRIASNTSKLKLPWNRDYYVEANLSEEDRDAEAELLFFTGAHDGWMDVKVRNSRLSRENRVQHVL